MMLNDYAVPNKELRVTMAMRYDSESLGAQTSATDTAHKGIKPKVFNVSLLVPFVNSEQLTELITLAESTREDGALTIYDITDDTANALNVRQVRFTDSFNVREAGNVKAWTVQFALQEYQSVPEKIEQRQESANAEQQAADGTVIASTESAEQGDDTVPQTGFEHFLAKVDRALS